MKKNLIYKVAFVGAGTMAEEHIKAFDYLKKKYKIVGIFSRTLKKAKILQNKYNIPILCNSIEELYKKTKADLLIIAINIKSSKKMLFKSISFNWKIIIEKPLGYNFKESIEIANKLKKRKRINKVFVGLNRRNYQSTLQLIKMLNSEKLFFKRTVEVQDSQNLSNPATNRHPFIIRKYWMYANCIHLIDYFSVFCRGYLKKILHKKAFKLANMSNVTTKLFFSSGDVGIYKCDWKKKIRWSVKLKSKKSIFILKPLEKLLLKKLNNKIKKTYIDYKKDYMFKPGILQQALEAYKMLNKTKNNLPTCSSSFKSMNLVNKIYNI